MPAAQQLIWRELTTSSMHAAGSCLACLASNEAMYKYNRRFRCMRNSQTGLVDQFAMIKPHGLSESDLGWPGGRGDDGEGERTGSSWRAERRRRSAGVLKKQKLSLMEEVLTEVWRRKRSKLIRIKVINFINYRWFSNLLQNYSKKFYHKLKPYFLKLACQGFTDLNVWKKYNRTTCLVRDILQNCIFKCIMKVIDLDSFWHATSQICASRLYVTRPSVLDTTSKSYLRFAKIPMTDGGRVQSVMASRLFGWKAQPTCHRAL